MAGITSSSCPFKPTRTPIFSLSSSSSFTRNPLLVRLELPRWRARPLASSSAAMVVARYGRSGGGWGGGGGGYRPGGGSRRPPVDSRGSDSDDDALDISRIKSSSVRLIDGQQNMVGIVSINEAIQMAEDAEKDLVILSEDADPPVLRLMDYTKFKYEQQKKKRDQQKKSAASRVDVKELKMGYNIDSHDYSVRLKAAQKFLKEGDKVKIIVNLKGRQNEFRNIAVELIKRFQNDVGELATEEGKNFNDRNIYMILIPNKATLQKAQEAPKKKESTANKVSASI